MFGMFLIIIIAIFILAICYCIGGSENAGTKAERESYEAEQIANDRKRVFGGSGDLPYRGAANAPEKYLGEIADLIDSTIKKSCSADATSKYGYKYHAGQFTCRCDFWYFIGVSLTDIFNAAKNDIDSAEEYAIKARNIHNKATKYNSSLQSA